MDQNCHVEPIQKAVLDSVLKNADTTLLAVSGMGCDGSKITQAMLVNAVAGAGNDGRHHYKAVVVGQSFHIEPA